MAVNLSKGQRVNLDKSMKMALVGLGWDTNQYDGGMDFDLDASVFMVGKNGKVRNDLDFIFYGNLESKDGSVKHMGDNLVGGTGGDDEVIIIDFSKVPQDIEKIVITVTIYEADERRQNFGQVSHAYVRVATMSGPDDMTGRDVLRFDLAEEFSIETAVVLCEIYKYNGEWKFGAVGSGYQGGLRALCLAYGVNV